jgi:hypothetical protein
MANFLGTPKVQFFDDSGEPLSGGKLYSYISGTSTPKATYPTLADAAASTNANANPVILDSRGEATVVLNGSYKLILKTSADVQIWSVDSVATTSSTLLTDVNGNDVILLSSGGSGAVNYLSVTNATTGNPPLVVAGGSDTNIELKIASKGSGTLKIDAGSTGTVDIGTTSTGNINLKRSTTVTGTLTASSLIYPSSDGTTGQLMSTDGAGNIVFTSKPILAPTKTLVFKASTSTSTSVPSATETQIALATENFDTNNCFASNKFTPNVAGYYHIHGQVLFDQAAVTDYSTRLRFNGSPTSPSGIMSVQQSSATVNRSLSCSNIMYFNGSTDYVDLAVSQTSGGSMNVTNAFLMGYLIQST